MSLQFKISYEYNSAALKSSALEDINSNCAESFLPVSPSIAGPLLNMTLLTQKSCVLGDLNNDCRVFSPVSPADGYSKAVFWLEIYDYFKTIFWVELYCHEELCPWRPQQWLCLLQCHHWVACHLKISLKYSMGHRLERSVSHDTSTVTVQTLFPSVIIWMPFQEHLIRTTASRSPVLRDFSSDCTESIPQCHHQTSTSRPFSE